MDVRRHRLPQPAGHPVTYLRPSALVRIATLQDLPYVTHIHRQFSNNIGFVPRAALENRIERRDVRILVINGQDAGYTLSGGGILKPYRLSQIAISDELWRQGYGADLVAHLRRLASTLPVPTMTGTIRNGLPMHWVALATGARMTATRWTNAARGKPVHDYLWQPWPHDTLQPPRSITAKRPAGITASPHD